MRAWTVSEKKAGTLTQCLGVAERLDPSPVVKTVQRLPKWRRGLLSPYMFSREAAPDVVVSCGMYAERHVAVIRARFGRRFIAVHLQPPGPRSHEIYDIAFVSRHDRQRSRVSGTEYREMIGVPHRVTRELLDLRRSDARARYGGDNTRRVVTVLVGGSNGAYDYDPGTIDCLLAAVEDMASRDLRVLVSTSRRSAPSLLARLLSLRSDHVEVWDRLGENPYLEFLAAADVFVVTKDTVTMQCEALSSGKPVYVFDLAKLPGPKLDKFEWFHDDMTRTLALSRPFDPELPDYRHAYDNPSDLVARTVRDMLPQRGRSV